MRWRYAIAFGGCLAVSAVVLAQQSGQVMIWPQPVSSVPPKRTATPPTTNFAPVRPISTIQQVSNNNNDGYVQVQPVQSYVVTPNGAISQYPPMTQGPVIAGPQIISTPNEPMMPAPAMMPTSIQNATSANPPQYIQVPPPGTYVVQAQDPMPPVQSVPPMPGQPGTPAQTGTAAPVTNMNGGGPCEQTGCCPPCGPEGRFWVSAEYLLWWASGMSTPPLVTASPSGTPRTSAGVLGDPNTAILYGNSNVDDGVRSGFRLRLGGWFDCCQTCGIEGSYFILNSQPDHYAADCTTSMILARPIFNVSPRQDNNINGMPIPDSELICFPGVVNGRVNIDSATDFTGLDLNLRKNWTCDCCNRIDWLIGFRYLKLDDNLTIHEDLTTERTGQALPLGSRLQVTDSFQTRNEFYGPQVGLTGEHRRGGGIYFNWRFLLAFGTTHKEATINGSTTITPVGGTATTFPAGFLALPTNIGRYTKNDFSVVPEIGVNIGYAFSPNVRVFGGYSFIYWSNVTRAGDIMDLTVNTSQLPPGTLVGPARPAFQWNDSDFWAQGFNVGVELRY